MVALIIKNLCVILHVITGAAWFGLALRVAGQARRASNLVRPAARAVVDESMRAVTMMGLFIVLTLVFGLFALFLGGGFALYGPRYHTSILLLVILVAMHYFVLRPAWNGLERVLARDETTADEAEGYRKRIAMAVGIGHLLWLITLVLMLWGQYPVVP